jgi:hypothetical protein
LKEILGKNQILSIFTIYGIGTNLTAYFFNGHKNALLASSKIFSDMFADPDHWSKDIFPPNVPQAVVE